MCVCVCVCNIYIYIIKYVDYPLGNNRSHTHQCDGDLLHKLENSDIINI